MKYLFVISLIVIILALLVLVTPASNVDQSAETTPATGHVLLSDQTSSNANDVTSTVEYTVFVVDNEFSPTYMEVNKGDSVRLIFGSGNQVGMDEVLFDFNLPEFGVSVPADTAQVVDFVADTSGVYEYFCMTCSPQVSGVLYVN